MSNYFTPGIYVEEVPSGPRPIQAVGTSTAGFVGVAWGLLTHAAWWQPVALASAVVSLVLVLLWWGSLNTSSAFFALVFDVAVIAVVLWQR